MTIVDQLLEKTAEAEKAEAARQAEFESELKRDLGRALLADPDDKAAVECLAAVSKDLALSAEYLRDLAKRARRAGKQQRIIGEHNERHAAQKAARASYKELVARHKQELHAATMEKHRADTALSDVSAARAELANLQRIMPQWFDDDGRFLFAD